MTLAYRMGIESGNLLVTSSTVINSGNSVFDVINYGRYTNFQITAGTSQAPTFFLPFDGAIVLSDEHWGSLSFSI